MSSPSPARTAERPQRLKRHADFERIQRTGRRQRGHHLVVIACRAQVGERRVGFTVSRKVGGAVVRNRVKRWLREAERRLSFPAGWDLVVIAHTSAADAGLAALTDELAVLVTRACR